MFGRMKEGLGSMRRSVLGGRFDCEISQISKFMSIDGFAVVVVSVHRSCRKVASCAASAACGGCHEPNPKIAKYVESTHLTRKKESPLETQLKEEGLGIVRHRFVTTMLFTAFFQPGCPQSSVMHGAGGRASSEQSSTAVM